jgi:4'-phosphopantetheinyl transferase
MKELKNEIHIWQTESEDKNFCRRILSQYINKTPDEILFIRTQWGKPALAGKPELQDNPGIFFNLSHTQGYTVLAVTSFPGVGIDIEKIVPIDDKTPLAETCLSAQELQQLERTPPEKWEPTFYDYWTRKESVIKAQGKGLSTDLQSFSVSLSNTWTKVKLDQQTWYLKPLTLPHPWAGALTAERKCLIREYKFSESLLYSRS